MLIAEKSVYVSGKEIVLKEPHRVPTNILSVSDDGTGLQVNWRSAQVHDSVWLKNYEQRTKHISVETTLDLT